MKEPKNYRSLNPKEIAVAQKVFKKAIPYDKVTVTDGIGAYNRPFTLPTSIPFYLPLYKDFRVPVGKYALHVGSDYAGMDGTKDGRELLVHELVHVWQGEDSTWSWTYVIFSAKDQAIGGSKAYKYDKKRLLPWSHYGPEQQAQIVEDWYKDGMKTFDPAKQEGDRRFYYIKKHIRGEPVRGDWTFVPIRPLESGTLNVPMSYPDIAAIRILPVLNRKVLTGETEKISARRRELVRIFSEFGPESAAELAERLEKRQRDDDLAQAFNHRLATETRNALLHILKATARNG